MESKFSGREPGYVPSWVGKQRGFVVLHEDYEVTDAEREWFGAHLLTLTQTPYVGRGSVYFIRQERPFFFGYDGHLREWRSVTDLAAARGTARSGSPPPGAPSPPDATK